MTLPVVAIIGRPNVGKSSLLNALAGERISIVEPTAGVTRDRISTIIDKNDQYFELIDTGGYGMYSTGSSQVVDSNELDEHVEGQIRKAIESANLILFMTDIRDGVVPLDERIARLLRKTDVDIIGVANKADTGRMFPAAGEFSKLGFGEFLCISATNNLNKSVLLDRIFDKIDHLELSKPTQSAMKVTIIGKRNADKSTLVNAMVGTERVIVSEIAGTTRDAVDIRIEKNGKIITVIDTAGVRKKSKISDSIEFYSYVRATRSISRADVILFLVDATVPISQVDKKLARFITEEYKSCIIVINKWDLAKKSTVTGNYEQYLTKILPGLKYAPLAFTTATEAKNVQSVLDLAIEIFKQTTMQIPTAKLNKAFEIIKQKKIGASKRSKSGWPKIYYATQIAVNPVTILIFVNKPELFEENYMRFVASQLRALLPMPEVPIRLLARRHRELRVLSQKKRSR